MGKKKQGNRRMYKEQMGLSVHSLNLNISFSLGLSSPPWRMTVKCVTHPHGSNQAYKQFPMHYCNSTLKYKKMQVSKINVMLELSALNCVRSISFQNSDALTIICNKLLAVNNNTPPYPNTSLIIAWHWHWNLNWIPIQLSLFLLLWVQAHPHFQWFSDSLIILLL